MSSPSPWMAAANTYILINFMNAIIYVQIIIRENLLFYLVGTILNDSLKNIRENLLFYLVGNILNDALGNIRENLLFYLVGTVLNDALRYIREN